jgi:hypothetical protein
MIRRFVLACVIAVFAGGLVLGIAEVRAQSGPPSGNPGTPFSAILSKLDLLLGSVGTDASEKLDLVLAYLDFFNGGNIVGAWYRTFPIATRFSVLQDFNSEAFLDRETGLVWDRAGTNNLSGTFPEAAWAGAARACYNKAIGGRRGWRPATIEELGSLFNPSGASFTSGLITGSVASFIWSSTTVAGDTSRAWAYSGGAATMAAKSVCCGTGVWCVRGGRGHDGQ